MSTPSRVPDTGGLPQNVLVPELTGVDAVAADAVARRAGLNVKYSYDTRSIAGQGFNNSDVPGQGYPPSSTESPFGNPSAVNLPGIETPRGRVPLSLAPTDMAGGGPVSRPDSIVVAQSPLPGITVPLGSTVNLTWKEPSPPAEEKDRWPVLVGLGLLAVGILLLVGGIVGLKITSKTDIVSVPNLSGMESGQSQETLQKAGLMLGATTTAPNNAPAGTVIDQTPKPATQVALRTRVDIVISDGASKIKVPVVTGTTVEAASKTLTNSGLELGAVTEKDSDQPNGEIIGQLPKAGTAVPPGTSVQVFVSNGKTKVPSVLGLSEKDAAATLANAGFVVRTTTVVTGSSKAGTVVAQTPNPGGYLTGGQSVTIAIAVAPPKPSPSGSTLPPYPTPTPTASPTPTS